jgi:hypothetical protein
MKKISAVHLNFFRNEEHYEFLVVFRDLLLTFPAAQQAVAIFYDTLVSQIEREEQLINAMRKSDYTRRIAEADRRIDRAIVGMRQTIAGAMHHFDAATVEAAQSLYNRFEAFGDITRKSYEEETADVNILIHDLQSSEYASKVALIGLSPWVSELQAAETAFELLVKQRNTETAHKPQEHLRDVRRESDILCRRMFDRIDSAATMDEAGTYDAFIAEINARIAYFNRHTHRHARRDISVGDACVLESVPDQLYTGRAVTPLPRACYREEGKPTVELVFAHDFSVTYKNNLDVGTADLILHGKGAYKGQKKTTFNISRTV